MTRWSFHPAIVTEAPQVLDWVRAYLAPYRLASLDRLRVGVGQYGSGAKTWQGVHGHCELRQRRGTRRQKFRIYGEVTGPYPFTLHADGTRICNIGEAVAWIVGHEAFHFLCASGQVRGRNNETEACAAGKAGVRHYRAFATSVQASLGGSSRQKRATPRPRSRSGSGRPRSAG